MSSFLNLKSKEASIFLLNYSPPDDPARFKPRISKCEGRCGYQLPQTPVVGFLAFLSLGKTLRLTQIKKLLNGALCADLIPHYVRSVLFRLAAQYYLDFSGCGSSGRELGCKLKDPGSMPLRNTSSLLSFQNHLKDLASYRRTIFRALKVLRL